MSAVFRALTAVSFCLLLTILVSSRAGVSQSRAPQAKLEFGKHIAPIIISQCGQCHGEWREGLVKGFDVVTYDALMEGGYNGKVIIPGNAEASPLVQYIEGRRTPRMPWNDQNPMPDEMIALIKRWINEGAVPDQQMRQENEITIPDIQVDKEEIEISCLPAVSSHLRIVVTDSDNEVILRDWRDTEAGQWAIWGALPDRLTKRPKSINVSLYVSPPHPELSVPGPQGTIFIVSSGKDSEHEALRNKLGAKVAPNPASPPGDKQETFKFSLDTPSDIDFTVFPTKPKKAPAVFQQLFGDLDRGEHEIKWNLQSGGGNFVPEGYYAARFSATPREVNKRQFHFAVLVRIGF